jgi:uncharacterized C2H2 Zn-finger protein
VGESESVLLAGLTDKETGRTEYTGSENCKVQNLEKGTTASRKAFIYLHERKKTIFQRMGLTSPTRRFGNDLAQRPIRPSTGELETGLGFPPRLISTDILISCPRCTRSFLAVKCRSKWIRRSRGDHSECRLHWVGACKKPPKLRSLLATLPRSD